MYNPLLSKTSFMHFLECPLWLWVEQVHSELIPPVDAGLQRIFDQGHLVDDLSRGLFPGGVEIQGFSVEGFRNTQAAIAQGAKVLYQPTAVVDGIAARADMLVQGQGDEWDLYEVKSSTAVSPEHVSDVAFQRICFERSGIPIGRTYLVHINNKYVREGGVDLEQLLSKTDITEDVALMMPEVARLIPEAKKVLAWPVDLEPEHLATCPRLSKCEHVGLWLDSLDPKKRQLVLQGLDPAVAAKMLENDVTSSEGLPAVYLESINYRTPEVRWPLKIDAEGIRGELAALRYPLHFFDYETYAPAVPPFNGYRPYQQIPFQFSVYILDDADATPRTQDFLMETFEDPALPLIDALRNSIGPEGTVISWYATFEKGRNEELAELHPEHAKFLHDVNDRTYDLMQVFKQKHYVHPGFGGSASLKAVMPTLIPDLSYKNLTIQEGGTASASWPVLTDPELPKAKRDQLHKDMIDYCRLDVYGMVKILDHLKDVI